jgi:hypothetical protein
LLRNEELPSEVIPEKVAGRREMNRKYQREKALKKCGSNSATKRTFEFVLAGDNVKRAQPEKYYERKQRGLVHQRC